VTLICVVVAGVVNVPGEVNTVMLENPPAVAATLEAAVIRPCESTVIKAELEEPP
jgi:hypothetical protein